MLLETVDRMQSDVQALSQQVPAVQTMCFTQTCGDACDALRYFPRRKNCQ